MDVIGTDSLFSEIELVQLYDEVFSNLKYQILQYILTIEKY